jgi:hypothetical protein
MDVQGDKYHYRIREPGNVVPLSPSQLFLFMCATVRSDATSSVIYPGTRRGRLV